MNIYDWASLILFFVAALSWMLFSRVSVPRIDRQMEQDGHPKACGWDGLGLRTLWIANVISLPYGSIFNNEYDPSIDGETVRHYGTRFDKRLGLTLSISLYLWLSGVLIGGLLGLSG